MTASQGEGLLEPWIPAEDRGGMRAIAHAPNRLIEIGAQEPRVMKRDHGAQAAKRVPVRRRNSRRCDLTCLSALAMRRSAPAS
jgi:hypothetical protein